jgi:hypothetical protein
LQVSTGRGGAGNLIRSPSRGVDPEVTAGVERGREFTPRDTSGDRVSGAEIHTYPHLHISTPTHHSITSI